MIRRKQAVLLILALVVFCSSLNAQSSRGSSTSLESPETSGATRSRELPAQRLPSTKKSLEDLRGKFGNSRIARDVGDNLLGLYRTCQAKTRLGIGTNPGGLSTCDRVG